VKKKEEQFADLLPTFKFSQADLARKLNVSRQTVSFWRSGRSFPNKKFWKKIESATQNSVNMLDLYVLFLDVQKQRLIEKKSK